MQKRSVRLARGVASQVDMGPRLLSREVKGWSIFRCTSSSRLKTCQTQTPLVFVYLAYTKYANNVT